MGSADLRLDPRDSIDRLEIGRIEEVGIKCYVADLREGDTFARIAQELVIGEDDSRTVVDFVLVGTVIANTGGHNGRSDMRRLVANYPYPDGLGAAVRESTHGANYHVWKLA